MIFVSLANTAAFGFVLIAISIFIGSNSKPEVLGLISTRTVVYAWGVSIMMLLANIFFTGAMVWR